MLTSLLISCFMVAVCTQSLSLKEISIPALGRPFALGDLYDRRRDYIIQGPKLWNHDELSNYDEVTSPSTHFDIKASQSIEQDMSSFDLSASIKMSFLSGLISVSGSASYLDDRKKKNNQARVSLNYKSTSFTRRLRPELFTKVTFPEVLKNTEDATDVIVAIQYGAGAIFTFDKEVMQNEVTKDIEGSLQVVIHKIPDFKVDGSGKVHIGEEDRKKGENLSCTFHGDFVLKTHPGTYEEAIKVYKTLPTLLGEKYENSVPVKVWLYPIERLPVKRSSQVFYEIRESMITSVTNIITDLEDVIRKCNDILDTTVSAHHQRIRVKVKLLHNYVARYILLFKQKLAIISPKIRKGTLSSNVLSKILAKKESSPFNKKQLEKWISYYTEEVEVLSKIQSLPNYCGNDGEFSSKLLKEVRYTVGLTLKLGSLDDDYLTTLEKYLLNKQIEGSARNTLPSKWWRPGSPILSDLSALSKSFRKCYELRKNRNMLENSGIQFLVREKDLTGSDKTGISIELYEKGSLKDKQYELVSAPSKPRCISKTHESVYLVWDKPEKGQGNLKGFKIITYAIKLDNDTKDCSGIYCKISETFTTDNSVNITGLKSQFPYYFTSSAYTNLGETSLSDMSYEFATTKCSPGTYQVATHQCNECEPGTFSDRFGMISCSMCPEGTYNPMYSSRNSNECIKCPAGTFNTKRNSRDIGDCFPCNIGTFSREIGATIHTTCHKCPIGTINMHVGAIECVKCKTNSYNPYTGKGVCLKCPLGTESKTQGATSVSQCVPLDAASVLDRKIDAVNSKVDSSFKTLKGETHDTGTHLTSVLNYVSTQKDVLTQEITTKGTAIKREYDAIHGCKWINGEGISHRPHISMKHRGVLSKEACVYNCMRLKHTYPLINGVTRKLSNRECRCLEQMNTDHTASTSRYQTCVLPKLMKR